MLNDVKDLREELARAVRMLENIELLDMNGHVSCRIPGTDYFLINARKASRASLTLDQVVIADLNGALVEGYSEPPSEVYIHSEIYKRRSDVTSIIHGHPHYQTVLGIADIKTVPVFSIGSFVTEINVFEDSSLINLPELGESLAEALGNDEVIHLRHHGSVVVGSGIKETFAKAVYVEEHAKKLYYASLLGREIKVLEGDNLKRTSETAWAPSIIQKVWDYHLEKSNKQGVFEGILG